MRREAAVLATSLILLALFTLFSLPAAAQGPHYMIQDLGTLGGLYSYANSINNAGEVVGSSQLASGDVHAYFYQSGSLHDFGTLGGPNSAAISINDQGLIAGNSNVNDPNLYTGFTYNQGAFFTLPTLGGNSTIVYGMNDNGDVVGYSRTPDISSYAFVYRASDNSITDLGTFGGSNSVANDINNLGEIVGTARLQDTNATHAFTYQNGVMTDIGTIDGTRHDLESEALAVNASGDAVGWSYTAADRGVDHAFLYHQGVMTDLNPVLGTNQAVANAINDAGQVVGYAYQGNAQYAFLYRNGIAYDLNNLINPSLGLRLATATGINDRGQIIGNGDIGGFSHAFLLTPAPEPGSAALLPFGFLAMGFVRRVRNYNGPRNRDTRAS
jgi:probable HAF family extracellular repeat protein